MGSRPGGSFFGKECDSAGRSWPRAGGTPSNPIVLPRWRLKELERRFTKRRELDFGAAFSSVMSLAAVPIGRLVPMGDIVAAVLRSDSRCSWEPGEKLLKAGMWLKLLRGEVETEPEDIGD
jgi:hypothetical protein